MGHPTTVPDPGKGVCADPVNGAAILGKEGPDPQGGNKERQGKGREKTWEDDVRRQQENKDDDSRMVSWCLHAQSKLMCFAQEETSEYVGEGVTVVLIVFIVSGK